MNLILGAGITGLSCSYHLGHENCIVLEQKNTPFGHITSYQRDGFTWDEGPHVSFTKNEYVKKLFAESVQQEYEEYEVKVGNYFQGNWIDHPAQTSMYQIPEPLRTECLNSFLESRKTPSSTLARDYQSWLESTLGPIFTHNFSAPYTRKYWTKNPSELTTDWIGQRILNPNINDVISGSQGPLPQSTHYINKVRYPKKNGYQSFAEILIKKCNIQYNSEIAAIDLKSKKILLTNGTKFHYENLINTLPLSVFIKLCTNVPDDIREAALKLSCTQLLLINTIAPHETKRPENWIYVYDEDKYSTRINFTEKLTSNNAPKGWTGVQTEVYFSKFKSTDKSFEEIQKIVEQELIEMGLIEKDSTYSSHFHYSPWANVIFDHETKPALDKIFNWLEKLGLTRTEDDLSPLTDWQAKTVQNKVNLSSLTLAGRFGQWKYYWSDDCLLRGAEIANKL